MYGESPELPEITIFREAAYPQTLYYFLFNGLMTAGSLSPPVQDNSFIQTLSPSFLSFISK